MFVRQISVFIENTPGTLAAFTRLLGDEGIDLISLSIADTANFGILRCIVNDPDRVAEVIAKAGYTVRVTDVLAAYVPDQPGGLAGLLGMLAEADISVEYLYSFIRHSGRNALLVFRVENLAQAAEVLTKQGVKLLTQEALKEI